MKKMGWLGVLVGLCVSCVAMSPIMTQQNFDTIGIGMEVSQVVEQAGKPYEIDWRQDGTLVYTYIERIDVGMNNTVQNTYTLLFHGGKVVDKRCQTTTVPFLKVGSP